MENTEHIGAFIKFVKEKQHAFTFLKGDLFCKPWIAFKEIEEKQRGDKLELVASKLQTRIYVRSVNRSYNFWLEAGDDAFTPVFCMYHVKADDQLSSLKILLEDERLKEFGNYAVVINNTDEFIARINRQLPGFSYGLIDYIDFNNRTLSSFRKPLLKKDLSAFEHQREFRLYNTHYAITHEKTLDNPSKEIILPNEAGAAFFSIGNIEDIAKIYSTDELFSGIEVNIENPIPKKNSSKEMWWDGERYQEINDISKR